MKPIQVTKPEPEDWERTENGTLVWKQYEIRFFWGGIRAEAYFENNLIGLHRGNLEEAQEACFQHYLKQIGAEK